MNYNYNPQEKILQISLEKCSQKELQQQLKNIKKNFSRAQLVKQNTNQYINMEYFESNILNIFVKQQNVNVISTLSIFISKNTHITFQQLRQLLNACCENSYDLINLSLKIEDNQIGSKGAYLIAYQILKLKNLQNLKLEIQSNNIKSKGAQALAYSISQLKNLKTLSLKIDKENNISAPTKAQQNSISSFLNLHILNCWDNEEYQYFEKLIDQEIDGIHAIVNMLENHQYLQELDLNIDNDQVQQQNIQTDKNFIQVLWNLSNLKKLNLVIGQYFCFNNMLAYPINFKKLSNLTNLSISIQNNCQICQQGIFLLKNTILNFPNLTHLSFEIGIKCNIKSEGICTLFEAIGELNSLTYLKLQIKWGNFISVQGAKAISDAIFKLQKLKQLIILIDESSNDINFEGSYFLGSSILQLNNLRSVQAKFFQSQVLKKTLAKQQVRLVTQQL
ncbi:hypothetical protein TTHERM_000299969 (macronuclear) [Tetrahymena thermophila SB210]|uniref:Kinase domain protein n=1 Tax=Tetrahymena thermophila (strain SB210) TaxID=312017 RepID=W7XDG2_TETTS|nr:hypothetical protein TTHERM_000299969 [Tetrahymena thermophila SB210]EWS71856.1 hypothetical protein TTHERM_000299969 [Tetrahymena thermophila SB210]|eukprot:XP_012655600.1 hypothetical protein TTHERM_000299969 [Tetrahymena thermophila SB210]